MQLDTSAKRKKARHGVATRRSKRWDPPKKAGRRGRAGPVNYGVGERRATVAVDSKLELAESGGTESGEKKKKSRPSIKAEQ